MMDALNEGADVNAIYAEWNDICPLHRAAESGEAGAVEWLVDHKADVNSQGGPLNHGHTALHMASRSGHERVVNLLLERKGREGEFICDCHLRNEEGETAAEQTASWVKRWIRKSPEKVNDGKVFWAERCVAAIVSFQKRHHDPKLDLNHMELDGNLEKLYFLPPEGVFDPLMRNGTESKEPGVAAAQFSQYDLSTEAGRRQMALESGGFQPGGGFVERDPADRIAHALAAPALTKLP